MAQPAGVPAPAGGLTGAELSRSPRRRVYFTIDDRQSDIWAAEVEGTR
jgi:hypothetical protein